MEEMIVSMEHIGKSFPGVRALNDVSFDLRRGEVHALIGENGAGKSTLMKILTGAYRMDEGKILYKGKEVHFSGPRDAMQIGIGIIHQELNNMPHLTVSQNIFIGKEPKHGCFLNAKNEREETQKLLDALQIRVSPDEKMKNLTTAQQQMVEIAKAMSNNSEVLIMDEPTSSLTQNEIDELFAFIRELKKRNVGVIYISHRLEELPIISDRITVLRDGQFVGTRDKNDLSRDEMIRMMVGREIVEEVKTRSEVAPDAPVVLEVRNLIAPSVHDVSFYLRKGEILGFAGLVGAGRTETVRTLFGADELVSGEIYVNGKRVHIRQPYDAVRHGIGYLSEDRKNLGLALGLSVQDNCVLASMEDYVSGGLIRDKRITAKAEEYTGKLNIRTPSVRQLVCHLSGGNQQKVIVARWLMRNCDVLIFDEPTRGIDVGAKSEIYKIIRNLAATGKSIILISSEMSEIMRMSDRILVMCEGCVSGELAIEEATPEKIMLLATDK